MASLKFLLLLSVVAALSCCIDGMGRGDYHGHPDYYYGDYGYYGYPDYHHDGGYDYGYYGYPEYYYDGGHDYGYYGYPGAGRYNQGNRGGNANLAESQDAYNVNYGSGNLNNNQNSQTAQGDSQDNSNGPRRG